MNNSSKLKTMKPLRSIYAVDLFCGAGGLTRGLLDAGIKVKAGVDLDPVCKYPYEHNNGSTFLEESVTELQPIEISGFYRKGCLRLLSTQCFEKCLKNILFFKPRNIFHRH